MTEKERIIEHWLYMQAIDFALREIRITVASFVKDDKNLDWQDQIKTRFHFSLKNWREVISRVKSSYAGSSSAYGRYSLGYDNQITSTGGIATYRNHSVEVSWTEIKAFIEDLVREGQQLSLFDLLLEAE